MSGGNNETSHGARREVSAKQNPSHPVRGVTSNCGLQSTRTNLCESRVELREPRDCTARFLDPSSHCCGCRPWPLVDLVSRGFTHL